MQCHIKQIGETRLMLVYQKVAAKLRLDLLALNEVAKGDCRSNFRSVLQWQFLRMAVDYSCLYSYTY